MPSWVLDELQRREKLVESGEMSVYSWEEVRERLLKRFSV